PRASKVGSVASTANQILFKNELYTSMKQKTMDQELMTVLKEKAQAEEKRKVEDLTKKLSRLETKRKVLVGLGDMRGPPGSDQGPFSSPSMAISVAPGDTIRDVKRALVLAALPDESPDDFALFDDVSEGPLKDAQKVEAVAAASTAVGGVQEVGGGKGGAKGPRVRLPRPYIMLLWAARIEQ
ncbi:unnamed protein product, partial [Discosporangium mesarthrocarpum]